MSEDESRKVAAQDEDSDEVEGHSRRPLIRWLGWSARGEPSG